MSLDATLWVWKSRIPQKTKGAFKSLKKLVLLSLADRAGEDHTCWPSINRLVEDTELDRKTVVKILAELQEDGLIKDTGERKGHTKQVKVYQLIGVNGREERVPRMEQFQKRNSPKYGTGNSPKDGTGNSPKDGTRNLPIESINESINKNTWFSFKKLKAELSLVTDSETIQRISESPWLEREKNAFEKFNANRNHSDDMMIYHFVDWLLKNMSKYEQPTLATQTNTATAKAGNQKGMSDKQIHAFAQKLSHLPEIASKYAEGNESYEQLAAKLAKKLNNPTDCKKLEPYLRQVGFTGVLNGVLVS
ncbi:helix-turn-helix domain-containing protein [Acinetobacter sp. B5B]|uniref:helix-turn-helix domain-containing protein n=1 Tax=Acinetobacter baretiae TaxID=2605383 RepID=UPI0018C23F7E|nr:helix-turn-helix domain-containing protein [Acinetobacter baretiae]MBF7683883.1 helix-turn-helix domain-containing protein [Acinetobacter baretiae]